MADKSRSDPRLNKLGREDLMKAKAATDTLMSLSLGSIVVEELAKSLESLDVAEDKVEEVAALKAGLEVNPKLYYPPFGGRGELSRLIAAAGGVTLEQPTVPEDRKALCQASGAVGTGLPVLEHGDLKMCQSTAVQGYIALISPKFEKLPATARARDLMWGAHVEDASIEIMPPASFYRGPDDETKAKIKASLEKWFTLFESLSPADGFVNGTDFPTAADCVAVYYFFTAAPLKALIKQSGFDPAAYPKLKALADRAAASPGLKEYIETSTSLTMNPFEKLC